MSVTEQETKPYARCNTCGIDLPTKDEYSAHMDATMEPTGVPGITSRSHSTTVVNPTPEEAEVNRVRRIVGHAVDEALQRACEDLDDDVRRGRITEEQVKHELSGYPDFADAWDEWVDI